MMTMEEVECKRAAPPAHHKIVKRSFTMCRAISPEDHENVFALRHEAYLRADPEFAGPGPGMQDKYDGTAHCPSYLMRAGGGEEGPAGSIRPCVYSPDYGYARIPAFDVFAEELDTIWGPKNPIVQATHFVMSPHHRGFNLLPKLLLIKEVLRTAVMHRIDYIIGVIRNAESLLRFYENIGIFRVGAVKMHPDVLREVALVVGTRKDMIRRVSSSKLFREIVPEECACVG